MADNKAETVAKFNKMVKEVQNTGISTWENAMEVNYLNSSDC